MYCESCRESLNLPKRSDMQVGQCAECGADHLCYDNHSQILDPMDLYQIIRDMIVHSNVEWANRPNRMLKTV